MILLDFSFLGLALVSRQASWWHHQQWHGHTVWHMMDHGIRVSGRSKEDLCCVCPMRLEFFFLLYHIILTHCTPIKSPWYSALLGLNPHICIISSSSSYIYILLLIFPLKKNCIPRIFHVNVSHSISIKASPSKPMKFPWKSCAVAVGWGMYSWLGWDNNVTGSLTHTSCCLAFHTYVMLRYCTFSWTSTRTSC